MSNKGVVAETFLIVENKSMIKLRGIILVSITFAFLSVGFFWGYIYSAVDHEPDLEAAVTDRTKELVELFVLESNLEGNLAKESKGEVTTIVPDETFLEIELEENIVIEFNDNISKRQSEIEIPEIKKTPTGAEKVESFDILRAIEHEVHSRSNLAREKRNRKDLIFDERLAEYARGRSIDMLNRGYFSHTSPDGCGISCNMKLSKYETLLWGENIARYSPYNKSTIQAVVEIFIEKWLKSSEHRDNLLSKQYTHEGVGVAILNDQIVITVIFADPLK